MTPPESLQKAFELHRAGQIDEAERLYRQVLAVEPQNAQAWHLMGVAANQRGAAQPGDAVYRTGRGSCDPVRRHSA